MLPSVLNCAMVVVAIHRFFKVGKVGSSNPELGSTDASHIPNIGGANKCNNNPDPSLSVSEEYWPGWFEIRACVSIFVCSHGDNMAASATEPAATNIRIYRWHRP